MNYQFQSFIAFSSADMDRLGRQLEFMAQNPVTRAVIESPCLDCQGQSVATATTDRNRRNNGNSYGYTNRGRGRFNNWRGNNSGRWNWSRGYRRNFRGNQGYRSNYNGNRYHNGSSSNQSTQNNTYSQNTQGNWVSTLNSGTSGGEKIETRKFDIIWMLNFLISCSARLYCHHHGAGQHSWDQCSMNPQSPNFNQAAANRVASDRGGYFGGRGRGRGRGRGT